MNKVISAVTGCILLGLTSYGMGAMPKTNEDKAKDELIKAFPNLAIGSISEDPQFTALTGLYEVVVGDQVYYFSEKGYLFVGKIYTKDGRNLTEEKLTKVLSEKLKRLPLTKAIKIGNGPNTIVEFTDPDCPYCRVVNKYLSKRKDVTRYIFMFPLPMHKNAANKAAYILSAKNKEAAHLEVFSEQSAKMSFLSPTPEGAKLVEESLAIARTVGIRATPTLWVNGNFVGSADLDRIAALLKDGKEVAKK
ncbi:MAG: DsbC family protein [Deltaproteobacteria bacterium]|nr:DsbC family protein [Deltaproteobacteria bacterium]TLN02309.1 MAG: DsbC family protein [bacterium]